MAESVTSDTPAVPAFGLYYDFRNPESWARPFNVLYRQIFEQASWADKELGFRSAWISEHHLAGDGYTPSPLTLAAGLAGVTTSMMLGTSIVILPLTHPLRLAEDALTVDAISGGRFRLGVGLGYRDVEFAGFGIPYGQRRTRLEEGLAILRGAFSGEEFEHRGRHFDLGRIRVTPAPLGPRRPELWIGGFAPAAVRRGAEAGDGMLLPIPALWSRYRDACQAVGRRPRIAASYHWIVADDPEAELARSVLFLCHQVNEYGFSGAYMPAAQWQPVTTAADLLARSPYECLTAQAAAERIADAARAGVEDVHWWTIFPGEPIERSNERLAYVASNVMPKVADLLGSAPGS
jgi:alkanesulfonate monooxygenase SsuD/methylene tetrahydromethanopterin reductase-like flavin-dependent oxidoreductase (luciferase family)